jgi:hypothetical protein
MAYLKGAERRQPFFDSPNVDDIALDHRGLGTPSPILLCALLPCRLFGVLQLGAASIKTGFRPFPGEQQEVSALDMTDVRSYPEPVEYLGSFLLGSGQDCRSE